jgi:DNA-binding transcriptional ArsR family regulator
MPGDADIAAVAAVLADRSRGRMLLALTDGRAVPAGLLADEAGIAASTASAHLGRLVEAGMVTVEPHGRHRYYRLAGAEVAELMEAIARVAPPMPVKSLRQADRAEALRSARTCYDHLAGRLGVALMDAFVAEGMLARRGGITGPDHHDRPQGERPSELEGDVGYVLTDAGRARLEGAGIDCSPSGRRPFVRCCLDWSERRHHLAGGLGARLLTRADEMGWIVRRPGSRAVRLTAAGERQLATAFGVARIGLAAARGEDGQ